MPRRRFAATATWAIIGERTRLLRRGPLRVAELAVERVEELFGGFRDDRAGREDRRDAGGFERGVVLRRDDAADDDQDVAAGRPPRAPP